MPPKAVFDVARAAELHAGGMPLSHIARLPGMPSQKPIERQLLENGHPVWKRRTKMQDVGKEALYELHHVQDISAADIGKMYGCEASTVRRRLVELGIPKGSGKHRPPRGPEHWSWRGGRYVDEKGYVFLRMPGHRQANKAGYVAEHRMVASDMFGKRLHSKDEVHHINGRHGDNRPENLIVVRHGKHQKLHADVLRELWALRKEVARLAGADPSNPFVPRYAGIHHAADWKVVG
jgi:hypothetical protein